MKNRVKLILVLIILILIILMEIFIKIKSNKTNSVILTPTPTQIQTNTQDYSEIENQPTIIQEEVINETTDNTDSIVFDDSEVGPTLTEQQTEEVIKTNKETGGFHNFIKPEDMDISSDSVN